MTHDDKVREDRLRRMARRQGLELRKNPRRDTRAADYGTYMLVNPDNDRVVADFGWDKPGWDKPGNSRLDDVEDYLTQSTHQFGPWAYDTEAAPHRWIRWCRSCHPERGHCEASPSPLPPPGALDEMQPWERAAVEGLDETWWVAAARSGKIPDWTNK